MQAESIESRRPSNIMYLLKKVFQLRDHANPEMEKPFLDHLEDLRSMIMKIVGILTITVLASLGFQEQLMQLLRMPIDQVRVIHESKLLPDGIDLDRWDEAKALERASANLIGEERQRFAEQMDPSISETLQVVRLLRAALALPEKNRAAFLSKTTSPKVADTVKKLIELKASPDSDSRNNVTRMSSLNPTESFMLSMKLSFYAGIVLGFPFILYFLLQFILPGLHRHEKRVLWPSMLIGFGLFLTGVVFAYVLILPKTLTFFYEWSTDMGVSNEWRIGEYISFATQFTLLFGVAFELPVIVMVCVKLGLLTYETMKNTRRYAILAIVIAAAVITPTPDALTMSLMAVPMIILYEICIWLAWFDERKQKREQAEAEAAEAAAGPPPEEPLSPLDEVRQTLNLEMDSTEDEEYPPKKEDESKGD